MKAISQLLAPCADTSVCCPLAGFGIVRATAEMMVSLRRNPVPPPGQPLAPSFLKHADEQTVAGLAAVYQAVHNHGLARTDFSAWGVTAAPVFLERAPLSNALQRYDLEGAWGISPHLIPHHSLHAVSGTISQALKIHGPNFGIGGSPGGIVDALLLAATLLSAHDLPGLWLVLTDHEPELIPDDPNEPADSKPAREAPVSLALALALVPRLQDSMGITLRVGFPAGTEAASRRSPSWLPLDGVGSLMDALSHNGPPRGRWLLGSTAWLELTCTDVGTENGT